MRRIRHVAAGCLLFTEFVAVAGVMGGVEAGSISLIGGVIGFIVLALMIFITLDFVDPETHTVSRWVTSEYGDDFQESVNITKKYR